MNDKLFAAISLAVFAVLTLGVMGFNYWIDPLWHYDHAHAYNDVQVVTDEREQKTADQQYGPPEDADTLLIGSSRSTYVQPSDFEEWDVYNYSVSNLSMREYQSMIMYAFEQNPDYERVVLGVDFFKSSTEQASAPVSIKNYKAKVEQPFYRVKNLLSLDVLEYSLQNFELSAEDAITEDRLYNRKGDAFAEVLSAEEVKANTAAKIEKFGSTFYGEHYEYFPQYKEIMQKVKDTEPQAEKIVYTTPISTALFRELIAQGLLDEYETWLADLVDVYGGVWNFMYPNPVTNDIMNYFDGHHFYPEVGAMIAERLEEGASAEVPETFGTFVTSDNLDRHFAQIERLVAELETDETLTQK
ncbi:hypothetical protein [Indiicoccus explosivorum]|uniref:hypothetical protein n=1 Tax=Indiicoccus explosivorum TaxID=1917864 RepID=UPI000B43A84A|nr:hypothetical protein [Indiicoccus explosivorum]